MRCPACNAVNPPENQRCHQCGEPLSSSPQIRAAAETEDELLPVVLALAEDSGQRPPHGRPVDLVDEDESQERRLAGQGDPEEDAGSDIVSTFIPYKNPKALAAYYCGFFALLPGIGFILGPVAIVLGIQGVRYASAKPQAKGVAHAITGIILGVVAFCCWNPLVCFLLWFNFRYLP